MKNKEKELNEISILAVPGPAFKTSKEEFAKLKARKQTTLIKQMLEKSKAIIKNNTNVDTIPTDNNLSI